MSLEKLRTARCIAGIHQVCKAVQSGAAEAVFIAFDADDRVLAGLLGACAAAATEPNRRATRAELGEYPRLDVSAAAVAILRKH